MRRSRQRSGNLLASLAIALAGLVLGGLWGASDSAHIAPHGAHAQGAGYALRLYGSGVAAPGRDRVIIPIDAPARPADIGATDVTIELWLKAAATANTGTVQCNAGDGWITGNTVFDRDIFGAGDYGDFGLSLGGGRLAFGVSIGTNGTTLCGSTVVADGRWHHIALVRQLNGTMRIFVDGMPDGSLQGPGGNASYRDGRSSIYPYDPYIVLGAEKHDAGAAYPSFNGWIDEVRLSTVARYSTAFTRPTVPFVADPSTAALYHFDEGPAGACQGAILDASGASGGPSHGTCQYGGVPLAGPVYTTDHPFVTIPPTATNTPVPPTATNTPVPPTATNTNTGIPPTATQTSTSIPPTATITNTSVPPTATDMATVIVATATGTLTAATATVTSTPVAPTETGLPTAAPATLTPPVTPTDPLATATGTLTPRVEPATATATATLTNTPGGTIPPGASSTPAGEGTPDLPPTLPPCPTITPTPAIPPTSVPTVDGNAQAGPALFLPAIQVFLPCVTMMIPD